MGRKVSRGEIVDRGSVDQSSAPQLDMNIALHWAKRRDELVVPQNEMEVDREEEKEAEKEKRSWRKLISLVLSEIENHKHGPVFKQLPKDDEEYRKMVYQPLDIMVIKQKLRDGQISSTAQFHRDILLMCQNAMMVNQESSPMYTYAQELKSFANSKIETLISTERMWKAKSPVND
jgi:hypothetical protein